MFEKIEISVVPDKDKFDKVLLVKPNIIYNRFDIKYSGDFDVLEIKFQKNLQYVAIHIDENKTCYIGIYMTEIKQKVFDAIIKFLKKKYRKNIQRVHITQGLIKHHKLVDKIHWLLNLPNSIEDYYSQFSSKTRGNRRRECKKLQDTFDTEFLHYSRKDMNKSFMERFFELKNATTDNIYYKVDATGIEKMLSNFYNLTDAYVLKINGKIEAFIFYSITDDLSLYYENMAYNKEFSSYNIGSILYYYSLERLIERGFKYLYLGGGNYAYKKNSKCLQSATMSGNIEIKKSKVLRKILGYKNNKDHIIITVLGIKIKLKITNSGKINIPFINKWLLLFDIKGSGNNITYLHKDKERNVRTKCTKSYVQISGGNNSIKFFSKTKAFFKGIHLEINGSNNVIHFKNYKQSFFNNLNIFITGSNNYIEINGPISFSNTEIELNNDDNVFIIKKTPKIVTNCYFCLSGLSEVNIGSDCGLNMGLYAIINNNYKERHKLIIGNGVYIGKDVIIRTSDGHSLIDPETKLAINEPQDVIIGDNVWIGTRSIVLKGAKIPHGSVVGAQSLVNKKYDTPHILLAGTPADIRKENVYWDIKDYGEYMRYYKH